MHLATAILGAIIYTRYEPVEDEEWTAFDSATGEEKKEEEGGGFWVVFFTIHKEASVRFIDELELALEEIGEAFSVSTVAGSRYVYVMASTTTNDLECTSADDAEAKAWMTCMSIQRAYEKDGCTLFAPKSFLAFDRPRAEKLLVDRLDVDVSQLK